MPCADGIEETRQEETTCQPTWNGDHCSFLFVACGTGDKPITDLQLTAISRPTCRLMNCIG